MSTQLRRLQGELHGKSATLLSECHVQHVKLQSCHVKPIYKRLIWMKQVEEADPDLPAMPKKQTYRVSYSRIE
jgi:hypothetical protein